MTEQATPTADPGDATTGDHHATQHEPAHGPGLPPRRPLPLTRSRTDRKLAGVAGGLGQYTGVDPIIFRIALVVLAIFGGSGILLYVLGWLLIREDGAAESELQQLVRGRSALRAFGLVVLAVASLIAVSAMLGTFPGNGGLFALAVLLVAAFLLWRPSANSPHVVRPTAPQPATAHPPGAYGQTPGTAYATGSSTSPTLSYGDTTTTSPPPYPTEGSFTAEREPQSKSILGRLTFSAAMLVVGVLLAYRAATTGTLPFAVVPAAGLLVVGMGLLVGARYGRSRWLIVLGLVLTLLTAVAAVADSASEDGIGVREWHPQTIADVRPAYRLGIGEATLDLRDVSPVVDQVITIESRVGVGELRVLVDDDVALDIRAEVDAGEVLMPADENFPGLVQSTDSPIHFEHRGTGVMGTIELDLHVGLGTVEVQRDAS